MALFVEIDPDVILNIESIGFMFVCKKEEHGLPEEDGDITVIKTSAGELHTSKTPKQISQIISKILTDINMKSVPRLQIPY